MPLPKKLVEKMHRAPGASETAFRAAYGLLPDDVVDWNAVNEICRNMAEGYSRTAAAGLANIPVTRIAAWERNFPAVEEALQLARARRLAALEKVLLDGEAKMPQVVSRIFALKNADPDEWKDKPGQGPDTPGLQQNITIVTGVPEAPQKGPVIEHQETVRIEANHAGQQADVEAPTWPAQEAQADFAPAAGHDAREPGAAGDGGRVYREAPQEIDRETQQVTQVDGQA